MRRTLTLKREVVRELADVELSAINGAQQQTQYSCLAYITCGGTQCYLSRAGVCP
jgi:hypothetical protein